LRKLRIILGVLFVVAMAPLLLITSLLATASSSRLYEYGFDKYGVAQRLGLERGELQKAGRELIEYFGSGEDDVHIRVQAGGREFDLFNEREVFHLRDVKGLIVLGQWIRGVILAYVLGFAVVGLIKRRRLFLPELGRALAGGGALTLGLMAALGLGTLVGFDRLFLAFHLVSFDNMLWVLNPATDRLIVMFPQGFFFLSALLTVGVAVALALVVGGAGAAILLRTGSWMGSKRT
jgi:integral membrane protein (TIGR01906 family)